MPIMLYSFKLRREIPLLTEEEYRPIEHALNKRLDGIIAYRVKHNASLKEAKTYSLDHALDYYEQLTGVRLPDADQLYWVQLSRYGRICQECGKPFRTPKAKLCAECGLELPSGEVAGAATLPNA